MIAWYHLIWVSALAFVAGSQLTSWRERKKKYNLNEFEKTQLHNLHDRLSGLEKAALGKLKALFS